MRLIAAATSRAGRRPHNEDATLVDDSHAVFAVSDGMGGLDAGDLASRLAMETLSRAAPALREYAEALAASPSADGRLAMADAMADVAQEANTAIRSEADIRHARMGATFTAAVVGGRAAYITHVGDSRAYRIRRGVAEQLTEDTSVAAMRRRLGRMSAAEYAESPLRGVLAEALGLMAQVEPEFLAPELAPDDTLLLLSDGVWGVLSAEDLADIAQDPDPVRISEELVEAALTAGSDDNVSAVVVRCVGGAAVLSVDEAMSKAPMFAHFGSRERARLAPFLERRRYAPGEPLCSEGEPGDAILLLVSGEVEVTRRGTRVARLQPPHQLGEIALVRGTPRTATVRALEHVEALALDREQINTLLRRQPRLGAGLMMQLARDLADRVVDLTEQLADARGR